MVTLSGVLETDMEEGVEDEGESDERVEDEKEGEVEEEELAEDNIRADSLTEDIIAEDNTDNVCVNNMKGELTFYKIASDNACVGEAEEKIEQGGENGEDIGEVTEHGDIIEQSETILADEECCKEEIGDIIVVHKRWKYQFEVKI